jgi:hypothetical protein
VVVLASCSRLESLSVLRLRLCGREITDFPMAPKHFFFIQSAGAYHLLIEDIPHSLVVRARGMRNGHRRHDAHYCMHTQGSPSKQPEIAGLLSHAGNGEGRPGWALELGRPADDCARAGRLGAARATLAAHTAGLGGTHPEPDTPKKPAVVVVVAADVIISHGDGRSGARCRGAAAAISDGRAPCLARWAHAHAHEQFLSGADDTEEA